MMKKKIDMVDLAKKYATKMHKGQFRRDGRVDFTSNGFKQRSPSGYNSDNASGETYIYFAWAEQPFKYSNAR